MFEKFKMDFQEKEFDSPNDIQELCTKLADDWTEMALNCADASIEMLNAFLQNPHFYDLVMEKGLLAQLNPKDHLTQKIIYFAKKTKADRQESYENLNPGKKRAIRRLNRTLLESIYPHECPHKTDIVFIIKEWFDSLIIAFILAMFIRTFFFQAFRIPSGSMRPTLMEGDKLIVNKLHYGAKIPFMDKRLPGFTEPHIGDIIVFIYPKNPKRDFIKRLIAKGGDEVEIKNGDIYANGELILDPRIRNTYYYNQGDYGGANQKIKIPEDHYFTLGDNSGSSSDSRYWGFVPEKNIIGKAEIIYWPPQRIRFIK